MGCAIIMSGLVPYTSQYARYGYGYGAAYGAGYPYGPYGMTAEDIQKVREAEEKAFNEAEAKRKEAIAKEKELAEKLGPYAYGPYGPAGAYGGRSYGYGYGSPAYGYGYPYGYGRYY